MRIFSGKFQRQLIHVPMDRSFRPTKAIVRESLFNILGTTVAGARFLDLCSGSGAIGLEADSRGAAHVICVDKNTAYLVKNKTNLGSSIHIVRSDVLRFLSRCTDVFDFIFFDPIWAQSEVYARGISSILTRQLLAKNGQLIIEHDKKKVINIDELDNRKYIYGNTAITVMSSRDSNKLILNTSA
jgi:16S rRNA (guanine966-N2)-methyltransferase